jgi:DNA-binding LacI/PurR family transcriptional regulator
MGAARLKEKRATIYDIAREIGIAPSSVSKALNDLPSVSNKIKTLVKQKALELNYRHNSSAANLRTGLSKTIGVIVPKINVTFFSDAIAGIEEACFENNHNLIICQSDESFDKEVQAVETLIRQNVDCIIISLSQETRSTNHLQEIINHHMDLIQFDRVDQAFKSHMIVNDNRNASYKAVRHLIDQGYKKIALLGGPDHLEIYRERKEGYLSAVKEAGLRIPYNYILDSALKTESALTNALELLNSDDPPDAFFILTGFASLAVLKSVVALGLQVPEKVGIIGFANEAFVEFVSPSLSSVDQKSKKLGKEAANVYFNRITKPHGTVDVMPKFEKLVVESSIIVRDSSSRIKSTASLEMDLVS